MAVIKIELDIDAIESEKIRSQFTFLAHAVQDLFNCIKENKEDLFVQSFFNPEWQSPAVISNATAMVNRTEAILNNVSGQVSGYHKELILAFRQLHKQKLDKSGERTIYFGERGDVAIDYGSGFGKAIQSKSSFADNSADINTMIKVAANQLTGERVELESPSAGDRRIVDVSIKNPANPWPRNSFQNVALTTSEVEEKIHALVSDYVKHNSEKPSPKNPNRMTKQAGKGYNNWHQLTPNVGGMIGQGARNNLISRPTGPQGEPFLYVDFITKIRYDKPRAFLISGKIVYVTQIITRTEYNLQIRNTKTTCIMYKSLP